MTSRLSATARREQLLGVALDVLARTGYHDTSMNDVAEAAGVTKPVLYQHFESKRELFQALLDAVGARMLNAIREGTAEANDGRTRTELGFRSYFRWVSSDHDAFKSLVRLVETGRCWVKLSAPYETSKTGAPKYEDVSRLARALVKHASERMLWASNWPYPGNRKPAPPDDQTLLDLVADWAPVEKHRQRMLVDNPAELYGY